MTRCTCLNISYILMRRLTKNLTFPSLLLIFLGSFAQNFVLESAKVEIELTVISSRCLIPTQTHPNLRPAVLHSTQFWQHCYLYCIDLSPVCRPQTFSGYFPFPHLILTHTHIHTYTRATHKRTHIHAHTCTNTHAMHTQVQINKHRHNELRKHIIRSDVGITVTIPKCRTIKKNLVHLARWHQHLSSHPLSDSVAILSSA